jgi:acyl-CoA synthetase (AMP-forming)/AMP-acid ligase II
MERPLNKRIHQKGVMISHRNVISNILQISTFEKPGRDKRNHGTTQVALGLLPLSHIYGLVVIAHAGTWRGDEVIILPKFDLQSLLTAIQKYKIQCLYLVSRMRIPCSFSIDVVRFLQLLFR